MLHSEHRQPNPSPCNTPCITLCVLLDQWDFLPVLILILSLAVVEHPLVLVQIQHVDLVWVDHD